VTATAPAAGVRSNLWSGAVIDADVHAVVPSVEALFPYLDLVWVERFKERDSFAARPTANQVYPPNLQSTARPEWRPGDGAPAASSAALLKQHILDPLRVDHAIVNCVFPVDGGHPDLSVALARAINDWLIAEWLNVDDRLRASIVVPTRNDPAAMVAEIDRVGSHPGFVQVLLPVRSGKPYGKRLFWPVFEAIERNGLVAGIHWGGTNDGLPATPSGWPSYYIEEYVGEIQVFESQLISLIAEGLFQKFPSLRVSMLEIGFTWVPMWLWDMDRNWRGIRPEVPWMTKRPFEQVREHVRFSTAPVDADSVDELARVIRWLGSDSLLMFATDYPHMHDDDLAVLLAAVPEESRAKLMAENARDWYGLPVHTGNES
jgi:predicted TIM-barrel fold metal-dependent hydrolase